MVGSPGDRRGWCEFRLRAREKKHARRRPPCAHLRDLIGLLLTYEIKQHLDPVASNFNVDARVFGLHRGIL